MTVEEFSAEREMLGSRDREELHEIASAMGVRGATRLRKADLIEAILAAATGGGDGAIPEPAERPKRRPVKRKTGEDGETEDSSGEAATAAKDVVAEPREQEEPAGENTADASPEPAAISAEATVAPESGAGGEAAAETAETTKSEPEQAPPAKSEPRPQRPSGAPGGGRGGEGGPGRREGSPGGQRTFDEGERQPFGEGRGRRRRRRGRDRQAGPYEGGAEVRQFEPQGEPVEVEGLLEIRDEGYGFMRTGGYLAGRGDVYVSASQVRRFGLRKGDYLKGATRPAASNEKYPALLRLDEINGVPTEEARTRPRFEDLTPLFPDERLRLEIPGDPNNITGRIIDLISPIGKGQRGLIVSPPKAGKTTIMKQIVHSVELNNPEVHLIVLLVDERPEEVTDMRRHVQRGEVVASTFDRPSEEHTQVAELTIERAKRLVELGKDVVIMLDGITRLARAYNLAAPASGRILSGGVDSAALYPPKKFFGAARNIEEGGSLTILATALIETGSRMDEVIFEEFKGTGNMELRLDRKLAERRIYPALDVEASSTRHEELLFDRTQLQQVWKLRRVLNALEGGAGLELLMDKIKTTRSNDEFLAEIAKAPTAG
jgi:transcription termination factor Rho